MTHGIRTTPVQPSPAQHPAPEPMRALLNAVVEALDVPLADDATNDATAHALLRQRTSDVSIILRSCAVDMEGATAQLRRWTTEHPVTYRSWQQRTDGTPAENGSAR